MALWLAESMLKLQRLFCSFLFSYSDVVNILTSSPKIIETNLIYFLSVFLQAKRRFFNHAKALKVIKVKTKILIPKFSSYKIGRGVSMNDVSVVRQILMTAFNCISFC